MVILYNNEVLFTYPFLFKKLNNLEEIDHSSYAQRVLITKQVIIFFYLKKIPRYFFLPS